MNKLLPHEKELVGGAIKTEGGIDADAVSQRIIWLISEVLKIVGIEKDSGGWETLYRDPADGRYWLLWYPQGEYHGGGSPALKNLVLTAEEVAGRFVPPEKWKVETAKFMRERNIRIIPPVE